MPDAGELTTAEPQGASQVICQAIMEMGLEIQRLRSYMISDQFYWVYIFLDERAI